MKLKLLLALFAAVGAQSSVAQRFRFGSASSRFSARRRFSSPTSSACSKPPGSRRASPIRVRPGDDQGARLRHARCLCRRHRATRRRPLQGLEVKVVIATAIEEMTVTIRGKFAPYFSKAPHLPRLSRLFTQQPARRRGWRLAAGLGSAHDARALARRSRPRAEADYEIITMGIRPPAGAACGGGRRVDPARAGNHRLRAARPAHQGRRLWR